MVLRVPVPVWKYMLVQGRNDIQQHTDYRLYQLAALG